MKYLDEVGPELLLTRAGPSVVDVSVCARPGAQKRAGGRGETKTQKRRGGRGGQAFPTARVGVRKEGSYQLCSGGEHKA